MQETEAVKEFKEIPKLYRTKRPGRRNIPEKLRRDAIKRALSGLESRHDIAKDYDVSESCISNWVCKDRNRNGKMISATEEVTKENSADIRIILLENEIAFLKKLVKMLLDEKGIEF